MAPVAVEKPQSKPNGAPASPVPAKTATSRTIYKEQATDPNAYNRKLEEEGSGNIPRAKYQNYLPTWDATQRYPPLEPFTHIEHGLAADATYPDLLGPPGVTATDLTPTIGTVISGIQISVLSTAGKDQLALLAARRKVLVFRGQDFADLPIPKALEIAGYFGRLHIHPTSGSPAGHPEVHMVYRTANEDPGANMLRSRTTTVAWHSDVSYEEQPPGTTFLYILEKPGTGGDTVFVDMAEAYRRLSPGFRRRLHGLRAVHSGIEQVEAARTQGSLVRRDAVASVHPIVRTHPATGEKALFVNPQFAREIVGYKKEEGDLILNFLAQHIMQGADFQCRVQWEEGTVVICDNRVSCHSALLDWAKGPRRYLARLTPQAERPFESPYIEEEAEQ
ncbi:hypothetical protein BDW74DRAFT_167570 [Aspergillus multicolor]|uniref:TauD/TfdA dioxygenase family protein n=1 Tax=Aspergillus multicolor TaxID=41759 RepID=UPI003CCD559F